MEEAGEGPGPCLAAGNEITSNSVEAAGPIENGVPASGSSAAAAGAEHEGNSELDSPGEQTLLVNKLIKTIGRLRTQNALLELKISDSDKQNKVLQLQIDIMMQKMDILEGFMAQVKRMDEDATSSPQSNQGANSTRGQTTQLCRRCKKRIQNEKKSSPDLEDDDDEEDDDTEADENLRHFLGYDGIEYDPDDDETGHRPLLIDVIVANIMSFLPTSTLLKCRLVNHLWYKEATYALKNRQSLTINKDNIDKLPKLMELLECDGELETDLLPFSGLFPYRQVKFEINFLVKAYREVVEKFLKSHGPQIAHFGLFCEQENSYILYTEEIRNIFLPHILNISSLEISVPTKITERQTIYDDIRPKKLIYNQLTKLKLRQMDVSLDIGGYSVAITKELLKLAPNLKSLAVETYTKEVVTRILIAMNDKECQEMVNQLEELYLDAFVTEEHLRLLLPLDFKLKTLQLSYFTVEVTTAMLEALLAKHRTTLTKLILGDYQKRSTTNSLPLIINLPQLRELRQLKFVDPLFPDHRQIMLNPLNYSEQLPNLSELIFSCDKICNTAGPHYFQDLFASSPTPCNTLVTLKICHGLADPQMVTSGAKMFPNLRNLELANVPDPVIQAVWREFTGIKTLYLSLNLTNLNIDSLMTGIPDQVCRRIQEKNLFSQVDLMNALDIIRTEASICNLTDLETLRVDGSSSSLMTAVTGYLALCHMPNLSNISIKADVITLSRECRRVLGETLHLNLLEFFN